MTLISEEDWAKGQSVDTAENQEKVLEVFRKNPKKGMDMKEIKTRSGLKWPYGAVKALYENGTLERKKFGKKFGYRLKA